mgnify:CR=1 FL=1
MENSVKRTSDGSVKRRSKRAKSKDTVFRLLVKIGVVVNSHNIDAMF